MRISCILFLLLHQFVAHGKRPGFPRPPPPSQDTPPPPAGGGSTDTWEVIEVPAFSTWPTQYGFGCQYGICGWGNGEFQFYHPQPFQQEVGLMTMSPSSVGTGQGLTVTGKLDKDLIQQVVAPNCETWCSDTVKNVSTLNATCVDRCNNAAIVSARIHSKGMFAFAPNTSIISPTTISHGKVYKSIKLRMNVQVEDGTGLWPAVWMLPEDGDVDSSGDGAYGPWPFSGEIDIFESTNNMRRQWSTIHFAADASGTGADMGRSSSFNTDVHLIEFIWNEASMEWYKDGRLQQTVEGWRAYTGSSPASAAAPFDKRFHLLINLAFGGGLTGQTDMGTVENTLRVKGGRASFHIQDFQMYGLV